MEVYECIFSLITGIGVFILAMKIMSDSLKELAGDRMKALLEKLANNRIAGVLIGALVTAVIQSSSATTVMVIGFVNADVMTLNQAAAIIIGSNIGTTATGLLASLESLNISLYISMLVFIGVMLSFVKKLKKIANLLTGLGMIFVGLKLMSNACNDESIKQAFAEILQKINFPVLLELLGMLFTAIIQSSSAMTGIVIVMVGNKVMGMDNALFITLGANVGTCITALIGIIGANINSKRTAVIHLMFNCFGCLLFTPILWVFKENIIEILDSLVSNHSMQIAYFHLFFNIITALITMPLIECLVKIAKSVVSDEKPDRLIVETMEEKESFHIRDTNTSTSNINFDDSRNLNENTAIDLSYSDIREDNKYEAPFIVENYFNYKEDKKEDDIKDKDSDNDEEDEDKNEKENVELILVLEEEKNNEEKKEEKEKIVEKKKNNNKNKKIRNKDKDKNKNKNKEEDDEKKNNDILKEKKDDNNKINENDNKEDEHEEKKNNNNNIVNQIIDNSNPHKETDIEEEKNAENAENEENEEKENDIKNDELKNDKKNNNICEKIKDNKFKENLNDKNDKNFEEEKDCERININLENDNV